jgi:hypothetical protein
MSRYVAVSERRRKSQGGTILVIGAIVIPLMILPAVGLVIDAGVAYAVKARLQMATDGAAIAAARSLSRGLSLSEQTASARDTATRYFQANSRMAWLESASLNVTFPTPTDPATRIVNVETAVQVPTYFMRILGPRNLMVRAVGEATRRDVNVMMVIDRSRSVYNSGSCDELRDASRKFVLAFQDGTDRMGLVTFGTTYRTDFAPAFDFQSRSGGNNLLQMTKNIMCTGGTNAAAGFSVGWNDLKALNDRGALNAIVFFTDGQPNTVHLPAIQMRTGAKTGGDDDSRCSDTSPRQGVLATTGNPVSGIAGIFKWAETVFPLPNSSTADLNLITNRSNCNFASNYNHVDEDIKGLAPANSEVDAFGNGLTGYKAVTRNGYALLDDTPQNLENAGINALDNAAARARQEAQALGIELVVYSVGLASPSPAEHQLLQRVANTKQSAIYDSTKPTGIYVYAEDASQLEHAFASLASDILRISK